MENSKTTLKENEHDLRSLRWISYNTVLTCLLMPDHYKRRVFEKDNACISRQKSFFGFHKNP